LREQLESAGGNDGEAGPHVREQLHRVSTRVDNSRVSDCVDDDTGCESTGALS
jgi:hypothetical protein